MVVSPQDSSDRDIEKADTGELSIHSDGSSSKHDSNVPDEQGAEAQDCIFEAQDGVYEVTRTMTKLSFKGGLTRTSTVCSWKDPGPPPDGGTKAWTQVALGHLVIMNTWGFINSFGVFQAYYVTALGHPPSDIAWVGSIQVFLLFFIGTFSGRLTDGGYFKEVFLIGSILNLVGIFMTSLSTKYWQLFLAQGVCCGLGNGCLFCPTVSFTSTYFSTKRNLAIGIVASGSAIGGVIFPTMVQQLLPRIGFGWTIRSIGFVELACLIVCNIFMKPRLPPRRAGPIIEWGALRELPYMLFAFGMFFAFMGVYFAFFYLGSFARDIIDLSYSTSISLILVLNGVGVVARLVPNFIADKYTGPLNIMIPVCFAASLTVYLMSQVVSEGGLYAWATMYGMIGAAIQSLFPAILSSLTTDLRKRGTRMGMTFTIVSFAVLIGPPIAGALISVADGGYLYAQCFAATSIAIGTMLMTGARIAQTGLVWKVKM